MVVQKTQGYAAVRNSQMTISTKNKLIIEFHLWLETPSDLKQSFGFAQKIRGVTHEHGCAKNYMAVRDSMYIEA